MLGEGCPQLLENFVQLGGFWSRYGFGAAANLSHTAAILRAASLENQQARARRCTSSVSLSTQLVRYQQNLLRRLCLFRIRWGRLAKHVQDKFNRRADESVMRLRPPLSFVLNSPARIGFNCFF